VTRGPLPEFLERRRAFCYLSALDDPLVAAVRLAGLIGEPVEGRGSRRQLLPAMSAVASEQPVPGHDLREKGPPGRGSASRSATQPEPNSVPSKRLRGGLSSGRPASLPACPVLYGQCWPGMIVQVQLFPSQETVDSLDK